ncbi:MAG: multiheme c-type cytochrome [Planctomycetota bacterium]
MRSRWPLLPALLFLCLGFVAGRAPAQGPPATDGATAEEQGDATGAGAGGRELFLVYSINNLGYIDVCGCKHKKVRQGSLTRRATYLHEAAVHHPHMLLIDGGNTLFRRDDRKKKPHERLQAAEKAKVIVEAYNRMGYRATVIGHYDLSLGLERLREYEQMAKFPFLSANLAWKESGALLFPPTTELEVNGIKVGILGLSLASLQPYYLDMKAPGAEVIDTLEAARRHVPGLRERNDLVIVLSQNSADFNRELAREVPGIDFILDPLIQMGSNKIWLDEEELREQIGDALILRTDSQGARLGTLDLRVVPSGGAFVDRAAGSPVPAARSSYAFERLSLEPYFLEDPDIKRLVEQFKTSTRFVSTETLPPLPDKEKFLTASACADCHAAQHEWWQKSKHSHAFASLEETGDQWRQDCIGCHTLGYGLAFIRPEDAEPYKNVQCESCHGLNPEHIDDPEAHPWPRIKETACLVCHNKEQTRNEFVFLRERRKVACPKMEP